MGFICTHIHIIKANYLQQCAHNCISHQREIIIATFENVMKIIKGYQIICSSWYNFGRESSQAMQMSNRESIVCAGLRAINGLCHHVGFRGLEPYRRQ